MFDLFIELKQYKFKTPKTIINRMKYIDGWFWCRYTLNSYTGCEHACIYCDARSQKYYLHENFDDTIFIKKNASEILEKRIKNSKKFERDVVALGGVCDAYQQAEIKSKNTQKILELLKKYKFPIIISTKSTIIERDLKIFNAIAEETWCSIAFTITSMDEKIANFLEPSASLSNERISILKKIKEKYPKIQTGINFMPIIPYLEDNDKNIKQVIEAGVDANVDYILHAPGLTLRDKQKVFFMDKMRTKYPEITKKILSMYPNDKMGPNRNYYINISNKVTLLCKKHNINLRIKRWIPNDYRKYNYIIAQEMLNKAYFLQIQGKKYYHYQKAGLEIQNFTNSVVNLYHQDKLKDFDFIKPKIYEMIKEKVENVKIKGSLDSFF